MSWQETGLPTELARIGVGHVPIKYRGYWYVAQSNRVMRHPGVGSTGLGGTNDQSLIDAAVGAAVAIANDPNYCSNVSVNGTDVNINVHAFKVAWNSNLSSGGDMGTAGVGTLPYNGQFDQQTVDAMVAAIGDLGVGPGVPAPCAAGGGGGGGGPITPTPTPGGSTSSTTNYTPWIVGGAVVAGAGIVGYALWRRNKRRKH